MSKPEDISQDVWNAASELLYSVEAMPSDGNITIIARALEAAKAEERYAMSVILQDPAAVYVNWLRGGIDARSIIAEEREACAALADEYVWDDHALAQATDIGRARHHQSMEIAAAIRKRGEP